MVRSRGPILGALVASGVLSIVAAQGRGAPFDQVQTRPTPAAAKAPRPLTRTQVKGDLYMVSGEGGNIALLATPAGVLLVDDMFDRNHADVLAQVKAVSPAPLRYVVNTHQHDDHAGGDLKMLPIAEVIAHENVRANLSDIKQPYFEDTPGTPIGLPRMTFSKQFAVHIGDAEVRAYHFGRGHTSGDAIIYFPAQKTVHTGDLFLATAAAAGRGRGGDAAAAPPRPRGVPIYVDYAQGGSFREWSTTLDGLLSLDFDTVIPGHGPVSTRADIVRFKGDLEAMRERLTGLIQGGQSRAEVVRVLEVDYGWRSTGCPPSPPTGGCLQYQQVDSLIAELGKR